MSVLCVWNISRGRSTAGYQCSSAREYVAPVLVRVRVSIYSTRLDPLSYAHRSTVRRISASGQKLQEIRKRYRYRGHWWQVEGARANTAIFHALQRASLDRAYRFIVFILCQAYNMYIIIACYAVLDVPDGTRSFIFPSFRLLVPFKSYDDCYGIIHDVAAGAVYYFTKHFFSSSILSSNAHAMYYVQSRSCIM